MNRKGKHASAQRRNRLCFGVKSAEVFQQGYGMIKGVVVGGIHPVKMPQVVDAIGLERQ